MNILFDFFADRIYLTVACCLVLLPFVILLIRKSIHFGKLLGFYHRVRRIPSWTRSDMLPEQITAHIYELARRHKIRNKKHSRIIARLHWKTYMDLQTLRRRLSRAPAEIIGLVPASQWFFDNYNLFYKELMKLQEFGGLNKYKRMPALMSGLGTGFPRVYIVAREIISCCNYQLTEKQVLDMLAQYQSVQPLQAKELWLLPEMLVFCLLEKIIEESKQVIRIIQVKRLADRAATQITPRIRLESGDIPGLLQQECSTVCLKDKIFVSHLFYRMKSVSVSELEIAGWLAAAQKIDPEPYTREFRQIIDQEEQFEAAAETTISGLVSSLKAISDINWDEELQHVSAIDRILADDPSGVYSQMNGQTRSLYRTTVEKLARYFHQNETAVATQVLQLALEPPAGLELPVPAHVGSYLTGRGLAWFISRLSDKKILPEIVRHYKSSSVVFYYIGIGLLTAGSLAASLLAAAGSNQSNPGILALLALLIVFPAAGISIRLMQRASAHLFRPRPQLAMNFDEGIPDEFRTFVVMPVIFNSANQILNYVSRMEKHFLANRQNNLYFALLGDFSDAPAQTMPEDDSLIEAAEAAIHHLNIRYPGIRARFYLLYRPRCWNPSENCWMGWERKRGKLEELNALLAGDSDTGYIVPIGAQALFPSFKYVITLDADTELIKGSAATLAGIMAHPLNQPHIDEQSRQVIDGYVIVQPEIRNRIPGPTASFFARLFSGQTGLDIYATVVSDIYQDVFKEGIFVGKGIYDVQAMHRLLHGVIPENSVLSHDLLEGSLSRCAFASGVKLMDMPPTGIISYIRREHRWIRGDWQLLPWLLRPSSINWLSRWKIFDNLRRSLVQPACLFLILCNVILLPDVPWIWLPLICFDTLYSILSIMVRIIIQKNRNPSMRLAFNAFGTNLVSQFLQLIITIMLLPSRGYLALDAIVRTLFRLAVSHRKLLEWQTAESVEKGISNSLGYYFRTLWHVAIPASLLFWGAMSVPETTWKICLTMVGALWFLSPVLAWLASLQIRPHPMALTRPEQVRRLRLLARRTWNYFEDFSTAATHWLCPDNYQKYPGPKVSDKTSPTNIGLQLLSVLSARDLGFIGLQDLVDRCEKIIMIVEKLPKWHGHLYNWYQVNPLRILEPQFISTVDSGNFISHLIALKNGLAAIRSKPVFGQTNIIGLADTLMAAGLADMPVPDSFPLIADWANFLRSLRDKIAAAPTDVSWKKRIGFLCDALLADCLMIDDNLTWQAQPALGALAGAGNEKAYALTARIDEVIASIDHLVQDADFRYLYDYKRRLFSIGYHVSSQTPDTGHYDLMASESRLTSFLAIAKGDVSQKHWLALGRPFTLVRGTPALLSWSGSMFEYLMPNLVLKTPPGSIFSQSSIAAANRQIIQGRAMKLPWGISESQFYAFDMNSNYQYMAFGVMRLRLQSTLRPSRVIAPYATMLALMVKPRQALKNIDLLRKIGAEGEYGFYEALDYNRPDSSNLRPFSLVQTSMAHHLGMSLVAVDNFLNENIMQARFHKEPMVQAAEILLDEMGVIGLLSVSRRWYTINVNIAEIKDETAGNRYVANTNLPEPVAHVLANRQYMLMLTSDGEGFSSCDNIFINRWRPYSLQNSFGSFIYIRNRESGQLWSSTYRPTCKDPDSYQAVFSPDKAEFIRRDGLINTRTDITLSPLENLEIRRITITNNGDKAVHLEVTSYLEVVADEYRAEAAHPAFSKLFIETEYLPDLQMLIASRRLRSPDDRRNLVMHRLIAETAILEKPQFEIDRRLFIGRNGSLTMPQVMESNAPLSCRQGFAPDTCLSLRAIVNIPAGHSAVLVYLTGYGRSREEIMQLSGHYDRFQNAESVFKLSLTSSKLKMKYLSIQPSQMNAIQNLVSAIYYSDPSRRGPADSIQCNRKGQSGLWRFGISGDNPILLLHVCDLKSAPLINDVLMVFEVLHLHHVHVDLVILVDEESGYAMELYQQVIGLTSRLKIFSDSQANPCLFTLSRFQMVQDEVDLLMTVARLVFTAKTGIYFRTARTVPPRESLPPETESLNVIQLPAARADSMIPVAEAFPAEKEPLEFYNGLGGFAENGQEYVIQIRSGMKTPAPWINVIANDSFGFTISETGAGYTWSGNSRENKLTTWSNDQVLDPISEAIYIRDEVSGAVTSPCLISPGFGGYYQVRHGFGYSVFKHEELGIRQSLTVFTARQDPLKLWLLTLTNLNALPGQYSVTLYIEWLLGVVRDQSAPYVVTGFDRENDSLTARNSYNDLYANHLAFIFASEKIATYTCDRKEFIGAGTSVRYPPGLSRSRLSESVGAGYDPCAVAQICLHLEPGETRTVVFGLGQTDDPAKIAGLAGNFRSPAAAEQELASVRGYWRRLLSGVTVHTPDRALDILMNGWLRYQVLSCRIKARTAFFQCGGAFGFRDQLQDVLAFLDGDPDLVLNQIRLCCAHQFEEGDVQHWWHPPTDVGVRTRISDDLLWLPYVVAEYIRHTGEAGVLDESVPYLAGTALQEGQREIMFTPQVSAREEPVYRHCMRAIDHACKFGRNGLPLMGGGDWNDGMNEVGIGGAGESVWLGWFLYTVLHSFTAVCRLHGDAADSRRLASVAANLRSNLANKAWDGMWYLRAFFDNGHPLGSHTDTECQIDSISQSWAALSGAASPKNAEKALESAYDCLVQDESRLIQLLTPPFNHPVDNPGYIRGYYPGVRENGGQYTHAAIWLAMANAKLKKTAAAWHLLDLLNPIRSTLNLQSAYRYGKEPYVMSADICMAEPFRGRAGWSWYTGSASWMYQAILRSFLGISRQGGQLVFDPCIPAAWDIFQVDYQSGSAAYQIIFQNIGGEGLAAVSLTADGVQVEGNRLNLADDGRVHQVIVRLTDKKTGNGSMGNHSR